MRIKKSLVYIIASCILFGIDLRDISNLNHWNNLQQEPIKIEWREYQGFPISKAEMVLNYDMNLIAAVIKDLNNYLID